MRSVIRHGARLARPSGTLQQSSRTRFTPAQNERSFHGSVQSLSETRGPGSGHNEHPAPFEHRQEEQGRVEEEPAVSERETEHDDVHPTETRKTLRKTLRQRRVAPDIPKPPSIPDWFLRHNVRLHADTIKPDHSGEYAQVVKCVDNTTGHTLFEIPYHGAYAPGRHDILHRRPWLPADDTDSGLVKQQSSVSHEHNKQSPPALKSEDTGPNLPPNRPQDEGSKETASHDNVKSDTWVEERLGDPLRWFLLEIESSIRAAFTLQHSEHRSYAASHIDISLLCPDARAHARVDQFVRDVSNLTGADVVRLDANDFADLTADYVGHGSDLPNQFSTLGHDVFDGFIGRASSHFARPVVEEDQEDDEMDEDEGGDPDIRKSVGINLGNVTNLQELRQALYERRHEIASALGEVAMQGIAVGGQSGSESDKARASQPAFRTSTQNSVHDWDEARLNALLDSLLEAPNVKRSQEPQSVEYEPRFKKLNSDAQGYTDFHEFGGLSRKSLDQQSAWREWRAHTGYWLPEVAGFFQRYLARFEATQTHMPNTQPPYSLVTEIQGSTLAEPSQHRRRTIVHVRDLSDICRTTLGSSIIRRLIRVIQKRRKAGEQIMFVGTTARDAPGPVTSGQQEPDGLPLRHLVLPPFFQMEKHDLNIWRLVKRTLPFTNYRVLEINLRHIQNMLNRTRPSETVNLFSEGSQAQLDIPGARILGEKVFSLDYVQRIVLTAIGLSQVHMVSGTISALHIAMSIMITSTADEAVQVWSAHRRARPKELDRPFEKEKSHTRGETKATTSLDMDQLKKDCNPHETRLLSGVIDPENIKTGFKEVHASGDTIETLKALTSLSLLRPDAFKYGILANDRLTGLLLYGPPGTGKTLLARAVAKESRATMLEISGAQIYEKYVGEGEKMVRAVFTLAKKISPCIVFIDEADSIFGSRGGSGPSRTTHREIINQFLREWDGMSSHNIFVMVASNRPFDLDDAALRRLPRRLLVDLPVMKDREAILGIHLRDEHLDASVSLSTLADKTPLYSGSDLKNMCVAAALACVKEENELAERSRDSETFKLPEKRTLSARHFELAMREISASISEDMTSLTAIRKFDEQYGDRRGRRKKTEYGFGLGNQDGLDESAARVRQSPPPP